MLSVHHFDNKHILIEHSESVRGQSFLGRILFYRGCNNLNNKGYQMIELFILLQLIQVLRPGSNLIKFYEDQKEVGVRKSISHK